jgi:5'(3')-deoxyribonucleotidase
MKPAISTIFLDVDGVLAQWIEAAVSLFGHDLDDVLTEWSSKSPRPWDLFSVVPESADQAWRQIDAAGADFWADLRLHDCAHEVHEVCHAFAPTTLLTSPSKHPSSHSGKARWIQRHFGIDFRDYLIGAPKHRAAHPAALLIDDSPHNCQRFRAHGGHAIMFPGHGNDLHALTPSERVSYLTSQLQKYSPAC